MNQLKEIFQNSWHRFKLDSVYKWNQNGSACWLVVGLVVLLFVVTFLEQENITTKRLVASLVFSPFAILHLCFETKAFFKARKTANAGFATYLIEKIHEEVEKPNNCMWHSMYLEIERDRRDFINEVRTSLTDDSTYTEANLVFASKEQRISIINNKEILKQWALGLPA